jgi:hypothetical protein
MALYVFFLIVDADEPTVRIDPSFVPHGVIRKSFGLYPCILDIVQASGIFCIKIDTMLSNLTGAMFQHQIIALVGQGYFGTCLLQSVLTLLS